MIKSKNHSNKKCNSILNEVIILMETNGMGKFYCSLCETSHHDLTNRGQCQTCARFFCESSIAEIISVGRNNCPYCDSPISSFKTLITNKTSPLQVQKVERKDELDSITTQIQETELLEKAWQTTGKYHDTTISKLECNVLTSLEVLIGKPIPVIGTLSMTAGTVGIRTDGEHVTRLGLPGMNLRTLPNSIGNLTALQTLILIDNQLITLPDFISNLTALAELWLWNNQLTTLPDYIGNLTTLEDLDLSGNQLTTVPDFIGNLTALERLSLSDNQIITLPDSIGNLTVLERLDLSSNQLTTLPTSLGNLPALQELVLWNNQLSTLPDSIGNLITLQDLDLSDNQLITFPASIGNLPALQELDLRDNQLTPLSKPMKRWLADLDKRGCKIKR